MKIEIRSDCKICGGPLPNSRFRTFCSAKCRTKSHNMKSAARQAVWQRERRDKEASVASPDKCQCLFCGKWYVQVGSHAYQIHGMTGREYREYFELEVKRGIVPEWYRKLKGDQALDNQTYKNLEAGAKFRFKKGQKGIGAYKRSPVTIKKMKHNKDSCTGTSPGV